MSSRSVICRRSVDAEGPTGFTKALAVPPALAEATCWPLPGRLAPGAAATTALLLLKEPSMEDFSVTLEPMGMVFPVLPSRPPLPLPLPEPPLTVVPG